MRLFFIRHGQSANNALWDATKSDAGRSEDPELTKTGHEQARLLAEYIVKIDAAARADGKYGEPKRDYFGITHVYTSLMVRAVATASYITRALDLPLMGWTEIHECGGIFQEDEDAQELVGLPGKTRSYFAQNYADLQLPATVTDSGWWNRPFESHEARPLRAQKVLSTLLEQHGETNHSVVLVSHAGFYNELIRVIFNAQRGENWFALYNTAVSRIDFRERERVLLYHNRTEHLPDRLIT